MKRILTLILAAVLMLAPASYSAGAAGTMIGTGDATFSAKDDFTREQALVTLCRMVEWCKPWYQELSQTLLDDDPVHDAANPFLHDR